MNHEEIVNHLKTQGYDAFLSTQDKNSDPVLIIRATIAGKTIVLRHYFNKELTKLPQFYLEDFSTYETLAHVLEVGKTNYGWVCINDSDSVSVNFEVPSLAYEVSVKRHLVLLAKAMTDQEWNEDELRREFRTNWDSFCSIYENVGLVLYFACSEGAQQLAQIKGPLKGKSNGIGGHFLGLGKDQITSDKFLQFRRALSWDKRSVAGKTLLLFLKKLPLPPSDPSTFETWYEECLTLLDDDSLERLNDFCRTKSKQVWVIFSTLTEYGTVFFSIRLKSHSKQEIPQKKTECKGWKLSPVAVRSLNKSSIVKRGGGETSLLEKKVLLVGCGSVGGELAHRLASTGIGEITLSDPDSFSEDNLYRHILSVNDIGHSKSFCLQIDMLRKYPWLEVIAENKKLQEFDDAQQLNEYDLIIVAIGSPTIERKFHKLAKSQSITTPIMNVWLEAYGVGGHSVLDIPDTSGCLLCSFVDPQTFKPGLSSNLNFITENQNVTVSHGGCGDLFLPYSAVASGYTSTMAADLASKYLTGEITNSSKMSWKGNAEQANKSGIEISYRYNHFTNSLKVLPLLNPECNDCCG